MATQLVVRCRDENGAQALLASPKSSDLLEAPRSQEKKKKKKTSAERRPVPSDQNAAVGRRRVFCCLCRADAVCFQQFPEWQLAGYNFPWVAFLYRELSDNSCFGQSVTSLESASRSLCGMTYVVELWLLCAFANFFPLFIAFHCTVSPGISAFHSVGFMLHLGTQDLYFSINTETNWLVNR